MGKKKKKKNKKRNNTIKIKEKTSLERGLKEKKEPEETNENETKQEPEVATEPIVEQELETKSESKKTVSKEKKKYTKNKIYNIILIIAIIVFLAFMYILLRPKFKDITIELGTEKITAESFLISPIYKKWSKEITKLDEIDITTIGEHEVTLGFGKMKQTIKLSIVDTTAPKVTFKNHTAYLDYEPNPNDFIEEKSDASEMTVEFVTKPEFTDYGTYKAKIKVKDSCGNETVGESELVISWLLSETQVEFGSSFSAVNVVVDVERFASLIPQEEIAKVNTMKIGTYEIRVDVEGRTYICKVNVKDTTPPNIQVKDITMWNDDTEQHVYTDFIVSVTDLSGEPTVTCNSEIKTGIIGTQDIVIEAVDINGNKAEAVAHLIIKKDTKGPSIYGVTPLTVSKHSNIDYNNKVYAIDDKDGNCTVTVNSSNVNTSVAGTYYATYSSTDSSGNTSTASRKITVNHDKEDTNQKMTEFYNNYCAGKDIVSMSVEIRNRIKYSRDWGGDDPVWHGLTKGSGNCYVHALIMQECLRKAGYNTQLIYLQDRSHYWNLVYINGKWMHIDATTSANHTIGLLTDSQKLADKGLYGKTWDRSAWPASED